MRNVDQLHLQADGECIAVFAAAIEPLRGVGQRGARFGQRGRGAQIEHKPGVAQRDGVRCGDDKNIGRFLAGFQRGKRFRSGGFIGDFNRPAFVERGKRLAGRRYARRVGREKGRAADAERLLLRKRAHGQQADKQQYGGDADRS